MYKQLYYHTNCKPYELNLHFSACPEISHCLENQCTSLGTNHCVKCDGEKKPDRFWAAYTSKPSHGKLCQSTYFKFNKKQIHQKYKKWCTYLLFRTVACFLSKTAGHCCCFGEQQTCYCKNFILFQLAFRILFTKGNLRLSQARSDNNVKLFSDQFQFSALFNLQDKFCTNMEFILL